MTGTGNERDRTDPNERYREAGRRSGEARRRRKQAKLEAEQRKQEAPPADRHQRLVGAFDRELDLAEQTGEIHNLQGFVALARLVVQEQPTESRDHQAELANARAQLIAKLEQIEEHARIHGNVCPTCGAPRRPRETGEGPDTWRQRDRAARSEP